jgi:hypothetical protein
MIVHHEAVAFRQIHMSSDMVWFGIRLFPVMVILHMLVQSCPSSSNLIHNISQLVPQLRLVSCRVEMWGTLCLRGAVPRVTR